MPKPALVNETEYVPGVETPAMFQAPGLAAAVDVVLENVRVPSVTTTSAAALPSPVTIPPSTPSAGRSSTASSSGLPSSVGATMNDLVLKPCLLNDTS